METPKSLRKPKLTRIPTPRLSERKKSLFFDGQSKEAGNDMMEGIKLLEPSGINRENKSSIPRSKRSIEGLLHSNRTRAISFLNDISVDIKNLECTSPLRRSPRTKGIKNPLSNCLLKTVSDKENAVNSRVAECADDQLPKMFNTSMRITSRHTRSTNRCAVETDAQKRHLEEINESSGLSPHKKTAKYTLNNNALCSISTKKFYSASRPTILNSEVQKNCSRFLKNSYSPPTYNKHISPRTPGRLERRSSRPVNINKGVKHKIRRPPRPNVSGGRNYRKTLSTVEIDEILKNVRNENLKNRIALKREERLNIEKIHNIFRSCKNPIEMARPLTAISGIDDSNNNTYDFILPSNKNSNEELKNLKEIDTDFSDLDSDFDEYEEISNAEEIIPIISHQPASIETAINAGETGTQFTTKRKFFKSARSTHIPKEIRITENIKASICNGKLSLIQEEKKLKKKPKRRLSTTYDITDEQATVEAILKNLDDTAFGDIEVDIGNDEINPSNPEKHKKTHAAVSTDNQLGFEMDFSDFRRRLPYNTDDPSVIEQQHLLLDFLINNNMCTEENFTIFIADPDNHKEEAARIVDQVFVLVNEQDYYRQRIPYNTSDPEVESQQHRMLDFLIENSICTEANFDIFIANYNQRHKEADEIMAAIRNEANGIETLSCLQEDVINDVKPQSSIIENNNDLKNVPINTENSMTLKKLIEPTKLHGDDTGGKLFPIFCKQRWKPLQQQSKRNLPRMWNLGMGTNQYQIDAGQKKFGAHQCKQCGLVYSIHEPEEEKLHREYHASLHLLRFKGWIDEDIVAIYPEWAADGRVLRITEASHNRRHERLADVLNIVDKELGFTAYVIPKTFVAYLAVRKLQIVGVCLVVPLDKANKYIKVDGTDCCTEEEYPAKCGISRIWVSPLHRHLRIASKLIHAVQQNTIFGEEIPMDKIAFSAPTESGRMFAQKVTQLENFLVYQ